LLLNNETGVHKVWQIQHTSVLRTPPVVKLQFSSFHVQSCMESIEYTTQDI